MEIVRRNDKLVSFITIFAILLSMFSILCFNHVNAEVITYSFDDTDSSYSITSPKVRESETKVNWFEAKKNSYKDVPDISLHFEYENSVNTKGIYAKLYSDKSLNSDSFITDVYSNSFLISRNVLDVDFSADTIKKAYSDFEELETYYLVIDPYFGTNNNYYSSQIVVEFVYYLPYVNYPDYKTTIEVESGAVEHLTIPIEDDNQDFASNYSNILKYETLGDSKVAGVSIIGYNIYGNHKLEIVCEVKGYKVGGNVFMVWDSINERPYAEIHIQVPNINYKNVCEDAPLDVVFYTDSDAYSLRLSNYPGKHEIRNSNTSYIDQLGIYEHSLTIVFDVVSSEFSLEVLDASNNPTEYYFITSETHVFNDWIEVKPATCSTVATYVRYCSKCNIQQEKDGEYFGSHQWNSEYTVDKKAEHLKSGIESIHCSVCDEIKEGSERVIPAEGHIKEVVKGKAATCTEAGLTEGEKCSECGEVLKEQEKIPALGHEYKDGTCTRCGAKDPNYIAPDEKLNGVVKGPDGKWGYYKNDVLQEKYTGFQKNEYGYWYIVNGYVDFDRNDILRDGENGWWKVEGGKVNFNYTGVAKNKYGWWRVENGLVNFNAQGIYKNDYGWWKTTDGKVTFKENGVFKNEYGWWKVEDSKVNFKYTGVAKNEYGWWRIEKGKVNFKFTGIAKNEYGTWYINKGKVDFNKNGKVKYDGKVYKVTNGKAKLA